MSWQLLELAYKEDVSSFFVWLNQFPNAVWLDSHAQQTEGRYDIISAKPSKQLLATANGTQIISDNTAELRQADIFDVLSELVPANNACSERPFTHGAIGYVSYDYGLSLLDIPQHLPALCDLPSVSFGVYDWSICVDHHAQKASLFFLSSVSNDFIDGLLSAWQMANNTAETNFKLTEPFKPLMARGKYSKSFSSIKDNLQDGNCYQVNLTHTFKAVYKGSPLAAFLALRQINPMPYAAFLVEQQAAILSFSPELFFKVNQRHVETQPIKGTAKVLANPSDDKKQQLALQSCEKNRAENLMIVDLLRNDMSRVSKSSSVTVKKFSDLKTFRGVHHLVSTITSTLKDDCSHFELFKALFPGGSITGAPKKAAMQLINELEINQRQVYCGAVGYFSANQQSQFNIAIRTVMASGGEIFCAAGGGIVMDSDDESEYQESLDKIAVITQALSQV